MLGEAGPELKSWVYWRLFDDVLKNFVVTLRRPVLFRSLEESIILISSSEKLEIRTFFYLIT
jgi:hypothetical protein